MTRAPGPIVLAVVLLLLASGLGWLTWSFPASLSDITGVQIGIVKGQPSKAIDAGDLTASLDAWNSPITWKEPANHHRLFNSDDWLFFPALYPNGNYLQRNNGKAHSAMGVLLSWYEDHGLDFTDPNIDREDPDHDGFSNIVEYKNEKVGERLKAMDCDGSNSTNPLDPSSHPDYLARLRLQQYESRPFHIQFRGYQQLGGEYVFQIFLADIPDEKQPPLKKTGDPLGLEGYIVGPFHLNVVTKLNPATHVQEQEDDSTLELDKPEIDLKIIVPFRKEIDSPESTADFIMMLPSEINKVIKVQRGKIMTVPYIPDRQFLILDANDTGAKIRDIKTNQEYHILKLEKTDWDELPINSHQ